MKVSALTVGPFQENTYLVVDEAARRAVLIDPGDEGDRLVRAVRDSGATLDAIWITHAHMDHVGGIAAVKRAFDVPIVVHPLDEPLYSRAAVQAAAFGVSCEQPPPAEESFEGVDEVRVGALRFAVMHAPGHAPGHVVLYGHGVAFVGDCLFAGSIGRTDLPLSEPADLARSLRHIAALPPETVVYPGHGPSTTIAHERRHNPFLNGSARVVNA